jgi:TPP-dependent pyruvate/acetoin dehydrogenase alpha subunit
MNFAGVSKAPCVFVCENNGWAISVPVHKQTASESFAIKAKAYGFEGVLVDGNDLLAVYAATKAAVDKARSGGGPTLIEAQTYRMGPHSTSDEPKKYRPETELDPWKEKDPILRFQRYLRRKGLCDESFEKEVAEAAREEAAEAAKDAEAAPPPPLESIFEEVYADMPWFIREQLEKTREDFRDRPLPLPHGH